MRWIIPKFAKTSQDQADARSTMVGRVTDAYTNIGIVMQDTSRLHRSVRDNILYGNQDAAEDDMIAAAKRLKPMNSLVI